MMGIDEIKKLDVKDRIILMNNIWGSLKAESSQRESPKIFTKFN
jgi:hypothetical protein